MHVYGLIGYPLDHSFSKKYFTEKFQKENLSDCHFELFPLQHISAFPNLAKHYKGLSGLAVTIPYKESVIPHLSSLHKEAKDIGAVNCIKISGDRFTGYNTDVIGFEKSLVSLLQNDHKRALVLGSGGASKAVQYVLRKLGMDYFIVTRGKLPSKEFINYDSIDKKLIEDYPVIINCTPVGMTPNENEAPLIPYEYITTKNLFYDLVYTPPLTNFLKNARAKGATIKNGYEMLTIQAEENWRIWNDL